MAEMRDQDRVIRVVGGEAWHGGSDGDQNDAGLKCCAIRNNRDQGVFLEDPLADCFFMAERAANPAMYQL